MAKLTLAIAALLTTAYTVLGQGNSTPLDSIESQVSSIFERSRDAIVRIHAFSDTDKIRRRPDMPAYRIGSGFFVDRRGWVLTTASNVDDADKVFIEWKGKKYSCIPLGTDLYTNLAMLRIDAPADAEFPELFLGDSDALKPGSFIIAIGFPFELNVTPTWGLVSGWDSHIGRTLFQVSHIRSNVRVSPGQGGGPLLNPKGEVVGMIVATTQLDDATYALPASAIKKLRDDFLNDGHARYGWSGLTAADRDVPLDEHGNTQKRPVINAIAPKSPALNADLRVGDAILSIDGVAVTASTQIPSILFFKRAGEELTLRIQREFEIKTLKLFLAERPGNFLPTQPRKPQEQPVQPVVPQQPKTVPASGPATKS